MVYADFIELVAQRDVRPERPDAEDAPHLSDAIWKFAQTCWAKDPAQRPTASAVCHTLSLLHDNASIAQPNLSRKPSLMISQPSPPSPLILQTNITMQGHTDKVYCATFSPDGKYIVSGSVDRTIRLWNAQSGSPVLGPLKMHTKTVVCVAFSPSGRQIASGSHDNTVRVWDALTGRVVAGPLKGHTNGITSVIFSPDGERVVSCSYDRTIRVWDAETGDSFLSPLTGHTDTVRDVKFSGDGTQMVSCSHDGTIRVWDASSGQLIQGPLRGHEDKVYSVAFSLSGKIIVSVPRRGPIGVWDIDTGTLLCEPTRWSMTAAVPMVFASNSNTIAVSPNGKWIVCCMDSTSKVQIMDLRTGQVVTTFDAHTNQVQSVTFSSDSRRILTTSDDKTIRIHTLNM